MFNKLTKLTKILMKKILCNRFHSISVGVRAVLRFLVSAKNWAVKKIALRLICQEKKNISKNIL